MSDEDEYPTKEQNPPKEETPKEETPKEETPPKSEPDWKEPFGALTSKVDEMAAAIASLSPLPTETPTEEIIPDEGPVKEPWTHKKLF